MSVLRFAARYKWTLTGVALLAAIVAAIAVWWAHTEAAWWQRVGVAVWAAGIIAWAVASGIERARR